jgi:Ca2+-binding RTX toxin-like protein
LYLSIAGTTDKLTLSNWFSGDSYRIEQVRFADGTVWDLPSQVKKLTLQPTQNDDYLVGTNQNDQIASLGGNDTLYGMEGDDVLQGGAGIDRLYGGAGNDALDGGADNFDFLAGGAGNDRYLLYRGIGQDTIADGDATAGNVDTIIVAPDIAPSDINAFGIYGDLIIAINGTKDSFVIRNFSDPSMQIERMVFSDGTVWDMNTFTQIVRGIPTEDPDALRGTTADDVIDGLGGADVITGLAGNDSLYGSGGDDQIDGGDGNDSLFGGTGNDQLFAGNGDDRLEGNDGADALYGDAGADTLLGGNGDDLLYGGLGNDRLLGGLGNDTYRFFQGIGTDTVVETDSANNLDIVSLLDKGSKDLWFKRTGNNLEISVLNSTDKVVVENWYLSTNNHIDAFYTGTDKRMLLDTNVDTLVSAMANYNSIPLSMSDSMNALINQTWTPVL